MEKMDVFKRRAKRNQPFEDKQLFEEGVRQRLQEIEREKSLSTAKAGTELTSHDSSADSPKVCPHCKGEISQIEENVYGCLNQDCNWIGKPS